MISILWGILAGMRDPDNVGKSDLRDRDIARMGSRVGQAFMVIAGLGVIVLCAFEADWFWIANTMFFGFALSTFARRHRERHRLPPRHDLMVKPTKVTNSIRALREGAGLTQAELAKRIGVTRQTLIAIEQGSYSPSLELAFQISRVFGVGLDDVFQLPRGAAVTSAAARIPATMPAWRQTRYGGAEVAERVPDIGAPARTKARC